MYTMWSHSEECNHTSAIAGRDDQSLRALKHAKSVNPQLFTKTSLMLGLGETPREVLDAVKDIRAANIDVLTLGKVIWNEIIHFRSSLVRD